MMQGLFNNVAEMDKLILKFFEKARYTEELKQIIFFAFQK